MKLFTLSVLTASLMLGCRDKKNIESTMLKANDDNLKVKNSILILGRRQDVMNHVVSIIEEQNFETFATFRDDSAFELLHNKHFDYFMIGGGIEDPNRKDLIALAKIKNIIVLQPNRGDQFTKEEFMKLLSDK